MKILGLALFLGSMIFTAIWASSSSTSSLKKSFTAIDTIKIKQQDREAQKRLHVDLRLILRTLRKNFRSTVRRSTTELLHHLLSPHGESVQFDLIKEWTTALQPALRNLLTDASGDLRDAVKRRWEALEGPVKKRRNAFDASLPPAVAQAEKPREFGRARLPGFRDLGVADRDINNDL